MTEPAPLPEVTFAIRPARETDEAFLFSSFLKSLRESDQCEGIPNGRFFEHFKVEFQRISESFTILVAHPEGEADEIAGWIAFDGDVVGWLYTKHVWRRLGAARRLLEAANLSKPPIRDREGLVATESTVDLKALYASKWSLALAKLKGVRVSMLPHTKVVRMLWGAS